MQHELTASGLAFRLRPVEMADAALILGLRSPSDRTRHMHPVDGSLDAQRAWLEEYEKRAGDYYFVVESQRGEAEGLVGLYYVDAAKRTAEWGRWILRPGSLAAPESARLIYQIGFETLGLDEVYCRTITQNEAVLSFHDSSGAARRTVLPAHFSFSGRTHDAVEHVVTRALWPAVRETLDAAARLVARRLARAAGG